MKLTIIVASMAFGLLALAAPPAAAQTPDDCSKLQAVLDSPAPADPAQAAADTAARNLVRSTQAALQCAAETPEAFTFDAQLLTEPFVSRCPTPAPAPEPPASTVPIRQFNAAVTAFNAWAQTHTAALNCRRAEVESLRKHTAILGGATVVWNRRTQAEANAAVEAFNARSRRR